MSDDDSSDCDFFGISSKKKKEEQKISIQDKDETEQEKKFLNKKRENTEKSNEDKKEINTEKCSFTDGLIWPSSICCEKSWKRFKRNSSIEKLGCSQIAVIYSNLSHPSGEFIRYREEKVKLLQNLYSNTPENSVNQKGIEDIVVQGKGGKLLPLDLVRWLTYIVKNGKQLQTAKLHSLFSNKLSALISRKLNDKKEKTYIQFIIPTPFGSASERIEERGISFSRIRAVKAYSNLKKITKSKQKKALEIIDDFLDAESQNGKIEEILEKLVMEMPEGISKKVSEAQFTKRELINLSHIFIDLVYNLPKLNNDGGIFERAHIHWYLKELEKEQD